MNKKSEWSTLISVATNSPDWRISRLSIFAAKSKSSFVNGPFGSDLLTSELTDTGAPVIYIRDILNRRYQRKSTECVKKQKADKLEACKTIEGDVLLAKVGDPPCEAAVYEEREDAIVTQDVIRIRTGDINASHFLVQLLNSDIGKRQINRIKITGTRERVSLTDLKKLQLPMPPFAEQKKIAHILSTWDKAIETVEKLIENSEARKKALIQQLLTGKRRFKEFGDSAKRGRTAEGWCITPLIDSHAVVIDGDRGKSYPKANDFTEDGYCLFLSAKNVTKDGFSFDERQFVSQEKNGQLRKGRLERGDIVLTTRGTVGNVAYYDLAIPFDVVRINSGMVILRNSGERLENDYLYRLFQSRIIERQIKGLSFGSAQPQLTVKIINNLKIPYPRKDEQKKIVKTLSACDKEIKNLKNQLSSLKAQKKALMQQLLTGKRRVKVDEP